MIITFLGTGTSQGVPVIGCSCEVCNSLDWRDKRLRTSIHIAVDGKSFIIDSGPDFRQQVIRERINHLDAVIFTHEHKDHTAGLDDIRSYNFLQDQAIPVFGRDRVLQQLKQEYAYIFTNQSYPGIPRLELHEIKNEPFKAEGVPFVPIEVFHHQLPVFGFRIKDFTYITDANYIPDEEKEKIKGSTVLVLDSLQKQKHISHFNLQEAIEVVQELQPREAYLIHLSHKMGLHQEISEELPEGISLAYDGLTIKMNP